MKKISLLLSLALLLALSLVVISGCDDDDNPVTASIVKPFVTAVVAGDMRMKVDDRSGYSAFVNVTNFSKIPGVAINGTDLAIEQEMSIYGGGLGFYGDFESLTDNQANLVVNFGAGNETATGAVKVPAQCVAIGPDDIELTDFQDETLTWATSEGADNYMLFGRFTFNYNDNDGNHQEFRNRFQVIISDTTFTLTAEQMFPPQADVAEFTYMSTDLDVIPVSGPINPGDVCNISGACKGAIVGYGRELDFDFTRPGGGGIEVKNNSEENVDWKTIIREHINQISK